MNKRNVAIIIFYDDDFNVIVQERRKHAKIGEKYGFIGGSIEKNETPEQAVKRESFEEVGFIPEKLDYWTNHSFIVQEQGKYKGWLVNIHVFLSPITPEIEKAKITEGERIIKMDIDKAIKGGGFNLGNADFLKKLKNKIKETKKTNPKLWVS